jgi:hypothetical protein
MCCREKKWWENGGKSGKKVGKSGKQENMLKTTILSIQNMLKFTTLYF